MIGRWFSAGPPASSTTKTGRHDIAEILLKVALKINQSIIKVEFISLSSIMIVFLSEIEIFFQFSSKYSDNLAV
jgi:hypothetical protein